MSNLSSDFKFVILTGLCIGLDRGLSLLIITTEAHMSAGQVLKEVTSHVHGIRLKFPRNS